MSPETYVLVGIITGWPPAAAGMWLTWYLAKRKVAQAVTEQSRFIARLTRDQTTAILGHEDHEVGSGGV